MEEVHYLLIISAAVLAIASPGPATLAISGMSVSQGRRYGLALASGVLTGSLFWSCSAAFGLGALMYAHAWLFDIFKYLGASYLLYLSYRSMRSAFMHKSAEMTVRKVNTYSAAYLNGLLIHLTNPKAVLFFGSLYSLGVPPETNMFALLKVILTIGCTSAAIFFGYALLFSIEPVREMYAKSRRYFEVAFAVFFGIAACKVLMSRVTT